MPNTDLSESKALGFAGLTHTQRGELTLSRHQEKETAMKQVLTTQPEEHDERQLELPFPERGSSGGTHS